MSWYQFSQNNSFGVFDVDDKLCHRLFIEANIKEEAVNKAVELGCYFGGVDGGIDCPCCGDRWDDSPELIDLKEINERGYSVECRDAITCSKNTVESVWYSLYGKYECAEEPHWATAGEYFRSYVGRIRFRDIEEYAQYLSNEFGWTSPDARLYYADGRVKEIYAQR